MTTIQDDQLFEHAERCRDKVVLITGAANGIGRMTATQLAKFGAKVVIGDVDVAGAQATVNLIKSLGGDAAFKRCDVLSWDDQVDLFEFAMSQYKSVDIVVPNAGVTELGQFLALTMTSGPHPRPVKPNVKTIEINLLAVLDTVSLAQHYLLLNRTSSDSLKSIVLIASMASWFDIPGAPMYSASKHALLGVMRALSVPYELKGIRISSIHPWFADTNILPTITKAILAGIPLTPVDRIAGAIIYSATDPDPETHGCPWLLPDDGPLYLIKKEELREGVYGMLSSRVARVVGTVKSIKHLVDTTTTLARLFAKPIALAMVLGAAAYAWRAYG